MILLLLAPPFFFALTNPIDNKLTRFEGLKKTSTLVFLFAFCNVLFAPILFVIHPPVLPPLETLPFLFMVGVIDVCYLFPYFMSYKYLDTSIVAALFSLGKIFTPILAFLIVGEELGAHQYAGFFAVVIASVFLSLEKGAKFKLNLGFWLMLLSAGLATIGGVVVKKMTFDFDWISLFFYRTLSSTLASLAILTGGENRKSLGESLRWNSFKRWVPWVSLGTLVQVFGMISFIVAVSFLPITLVETGLSFQPFLVLAVSYLFYKKLLGSKIWESQTSVIRKVICFIIMVGGTTLLIWR